MPMVSPLVPEMEGELSQWRARIEKVAEGVMLCVTEEEAMKLAQEEAHCAEAMVVAAAKHKAETRKQQAASKDAVIKLSGNNEPSIVSQVCFFFFFLSARVADVGFCG
jgi:CO dehydrogenase/acetyl-CoA synthase gamma subunit (corrinoid Fe-S protein)